MVYRNSCSMSLACLFSDWIRFSLKKLCLFWVDRSPDAGFRLLPCHYTMREGEWGPFSPKLHVRIKDNNSSPHGKFDRFLFPFSSKFADLNFASYVIYNYLPMRHTQWAWVTCAFSCVMMEVTFGCMFDKTLLPYFWNCKTTHFVL